MNATYNMDHLQAITHVASLLNSTTAPGTTAIIKPKNAATSHYDPAGTQVATVSNTSYEGVTFAADGTISGGNLTHESQTPDGTQLSTTAIGFHSNGKPVSAQINVNNISEAGNFKQVQMDMSGVTWNSSFAISSGQVKMTTIDSSTQQKKNDGVIQFNNEAVVSGSITHYDPENAGAVSGYSEVDYSRAKLLGSSILGGQYSVKSLTADKAVAATSLVTLSPLGRLHGVETTNVDPGSSAVTTKVAVDFSKIAFNARNEFVSGQMGLNVNDNAGNLLAQTEVKFSDSVPALSTTLVYSKGKLQNKIVVDYSNCRFNNDHKVINSSKKVEIYNALGKLVFSKNISYDKHGKKTKDKGLEAGTHQSDTPQAATAQATTPAKTSAPARPTFKSATSPADTNTTQKTDNTYRPDNTLEKVRVITLQGDTPVSALIKLYATDGTTVIKTFTMDLTGLAYQDKSNTVKGALNMQTHLGGNILNSESTIQY